MATKKSAYLDAVRISEALNLLVDAFLRIPQAIPVLLRGGPGVGKSAIVVQAAVLLAAQEKSATCPACNRKDAKGAKIAADPNPEAHEVGCSSWHEKRMCNAICQQAHRLHEAKFAHVCVIDKRLSQEDPVSLGGLPGVAEGSAVARYYHQEWLPVHPKLRCIMFLDEFGCAPQAVQNAALQLINDRAINQTTLSPNCSIVAATNRDTDGAALSKLVGPLKNRLAWLDVEANYEDWLEYARRRNLRMEIIGAVESTPHDFFKDFDKNADASCTPRTLERLSYLLDVAGVEPHTEEKIVKRLAQATIGPEATVAFLTFLRQFRLVSPKDIIDKGIIPEFEKKNTSEQYATVCAVAQYCRQRDTYSKENVQNLFAFLEKIGTELRVKCLRDMRLGPRSGVMRQFMASGGKAFNDLMMRLAQVMVDN